MEVMWRQDEPMSVRAVHNSLQAERSVAYTTVMTVLDRLSKKGVVVRSLEGRAWHYQPALSRIDLYVHAITDMLDELGEEDRRTVRLRLS